MAIPPTSGLESLLNGLIEAIPAPAMLTDLDGRITAVNGHWLQLVGFAREQAVGQRYPYPWAPSPKSEAEWPWDGDSWGFGEAVDVESQISDGEGNLHAINLRVTVLPGPLNQRQWLLFVGREPTPEADVEALTPAAGFDLTRVFEDMPAWVQLSTLNGTIEMVNKAACAISGYSRSELIGQAWPYPWFPSVFRGNGDDPFAELCRSGEVMEFVASCLTKAGVAKDLGITLSLVLGGPPESRRVLMVARDISEERRQQESILQAEKIRSVSQLASGVAHDINNDLAVILGYSEFLIGKCDNLDEEDRHALNAIKQQANACAETVRRIQLFSRRTPRSKFTYFSVNDVVRDVVEAMGHLRGSESGQAHASIQFEADLQWVPPVYADVDSLKEAVISMVDNAVDALPEGGKVSLRTGSGQEQVVLQVVDDGTGIDHRHLSHIFEPFFTTKGPGSSGLGLSVAHNLVTQMDGTLQVESAPGKGTTFTIRFPAMAADLETSLNPGRLKQRDPKFDVMVVDDEPGVARMLGTFLEAAGHQASVFLDGAEAVEAFQKGEFDLVVVDLAMPGMDGWEVARRINEISPDVPIIVATGWNMTVDDGRDQGAVVSAVLRKPFVMGELAEAIELVTKGRRRPQDR